MSYRGRSYSLPPRLRRTQSWPYPNLSELPLIPRLPDDPYRILPVPDEMASSDPSSTSCLLLANTLEEDFVRKGLLATFDVEKMGWVGYDRRGLGIQRLILLAENSGIQLPHCPHLANPLRPSSWSHMYPIMRHRLDPNLDCTGYFTPKTHRCIWMPIPSLNKKISRLPEQLPMERPSHKVDVDNGSTFLADVEEAIRRSLEDIAEAGEVQLQLEQYSSPGDRVVADTAATFATDRLMFSRGDLPTSTPRRSPASSIATSSSQSSASSSASSSATSTSKSPTSGCTPRSYSPCLLHLKSFYSKEEAEQRKLTDIALVESIRDAAEDEVYADNPRLHPAFNVEEESTTPEALKQYHDPGSLSTTWMIGTRNLTTTVGRAIVLFNSARGITEESFARLRGQSFKCASCLCYFSGDGYQQHLRYSRCQNTPDFEIVADLSTLISKLPVISCGEKSYDSIIVRDAAFDSVIGTAWLRWHTRAGVTHDAWVIISTAFRKCPICGEYRSFDGHRLHLEMKGYCGYCGDDEMGIVGRYVLDEEESEGK